ASFFGSSARVPPSSTTIPTSANTPPCLDMIAPPQNATVGLLPKRLHSLAIRCHAVTSVVAPRTPPPTPPPSPVSATPPAAAVRRRRAPPAPCLAPRAPPGVWALSVLSSIRPTRRFSPCRRRGRRRPSNRDGRRAARPSPFRALSVSAAMQDGPFPSPP